jgi:DNA polymerase-3 subunit alpha
VAAEPWSVKERLTLEKSAVGFFLSGHLFDQSAGEVRLFAKRRIADLLDSREPQLLAGIVSDLRVINGQRGRMALFKLDDKSEAIEAVATDEQLQAYRDLLKDDELIVVQGKVQPDRFSGGLRLTVAQVWDLAGARCRFGKYLQVDVNGVVPPVAEVLRDFPSRRVANEHGESQEGLAVRLRLHRTQASADLDLGEAVRFYPTDAALARWREGASGGVARVVYE